MADCSLPFLGAPKSRSQPLSSPRSVNRINAVAEARDVQPIEAVSAMTTVEVQVEAINRARDREGKTNRNATNQGPMATVIDRPEAEKARGKAKVRTSSRRTSPIKNRTVADSNNVSLKKAIGMALVNNKEADVVRAVSARATPHLVNVDRDQNRRLLQTSLKL